MGVVMCPKCSAAVAMRINRNGFWQRSVLGHFGIYPWKCGACGVAFLYRKRGNRPRQGKPGGEPGTGTLERGEQRSGG